MDKQELINILKSQSETFSEDVKRKLEYLNSDEVFSEYTQDLDEDLDDEHEQDPFFRALHNSFQEDNSLKTETTAPLFQNSAPSFNSPENNEPSLSAAENETSLSAGITEKDISSRQTPTFGSARSTLDSLRSSNDSFSFSAGDLKADKADEPKLNSLSAQANAPQTPKAEKKEDLAYPFGGWTDEDNYR